MCGAARFGDKTVLAPCSQDDAGFGQGWLEYQVSGDLTQIPSYSFPFFFFSLGDRLLDEGKRRNRISKFTRIVCFKKFSVASFGYSKERRKQEEERSGVLPRGTCRPEPRIHRT